MYSFLFLLATATMLLGSCTKTDIREQVDNAPIRTHVVASAWTSEVSMAWSDTTTASHPHKYFSWDAPELTEDIMHNGAVLVYAKIRLEDSEVLMPATFYYTTGVDYDTYECTPTMASLHLVHSKFVGGAFEQPDVRDDISFRYILLQGVPHPDGRTETGKIGGYTVEELRAMSYNELISLFKIAK